MPTPDREPPDDAWTHEEDDLDGGLCRRRYPLPWHRPMGCTCPSEFVRHRDCPVPDHQRQYEDARDDNET